MKVYEWNRGEVGNLTEHFMASEFECKCGKCTEQQIDVDFLHKLEASRLEYGNPIFINSGFRCKDHNDNVGGHKNSQHLYGNAVDILRPKDPDKDRKLFNILRKNFKALGIADLFYHVDGRTDVIREWKY